MATKWPDGFAKGRANLRALLVLSSLRGLTPLKLLQVAQLHGSARGCLSAVREGRAGSEADRRYAEELDSSEIEAAVTACGARFVAVGSDDYPAQLEHLSDPPAGLFVLGRALPIPGSAVAVVGARNCSDGGRDMAWMIGRDLAARGMCVVSGAARGIDAACHEGALAASGQTLAVLGCGIDRAYPHGSRSLVARIAEAGTIASEYPPGVPAASFRFPARNRIIAGLARGLVVVEGAAGSGSLISAEHALDLGREVFAVPGALDNPLAGVPHALIREGATLIRGVDDLLSDLGLAGAGAAGGEITARLDVTLLERAAFDSVAGSVLPETVARELRLTVPEVLPLLMALEMKGLVRSVGGRFRRRVGPTGRV
ncbi:MAG: DNA-processing protein DprA [Actinomycetota bacterium]